METGLGALACGRRALAYETQNQIERQTHCIETGQPTMEVLVAPRLRLFQPLMIPRQVEIAGAAGNAGTLLNAVEKFILTQLVTHLAFGGM